MEKFSILIIDDEEAQRENIKGFLQKKGYSVTTADSCNNGIAQLKKNTIDFILTDYKMPDKTGEDVLIEAREVNPLVPVVVTTAFGNIEGAVDLMKKGAYDYLQKPIELDELLQVIEKARERQTLINENRLLKQQLSESGFSRISFDSIVSESGEMQEVMNTAGRVADSKASVLLRGESGTGKELVAKAIHYSSSRKDKPFVIVNCAALPETLFESELFGHEKGSFTGAGKQRIGKFEEADGGTIFIDEVGDIPLPVQVKLLRAIQFGQIERLGSNKTIDLDVRIISATNRNLEDMINTGDFREDLYYRFNVVSINIPPLRKRKGDIVPLIDHFVTKYSSINGKEIKSASKEVVDILMKYSYPGNIRELENIIQRAVVLTRDNYLKTDDLPKHILNPSLTEKSLKKEELTEIGDLNEKVEELEISLIQRALEESGGNQVKAAKMLNINERTIRYKISKYAIK